MRNQLIKWYLEYNVFSEEEKEFILKKNDNNIILNQKNNYDNLVQEYFNLMLFSNITVDNYTINLENSGSFLIKQVFEDNVNDQTLVITTRYQHNGVKDCLKNCKNVIQLQMQDLINFNKDKILNYIKQFKNIFIYIVGVQIMTGHITPQLFFIQLKNLLQKNNKKYKIMLDDVHGMFLIPRDYSIFDYILYTAHSLIPTYQMGMLINKKNNKQYGNNNYILGKQYLDKLLLILSKKEKMFLFKTIMCTYFSDILKKDNIYKLLSPSVQHIFSIQTAGLLFSEKMKKQLLKYKIKIEQQNYYYNHIRIRYQQFIMLQYDIAIKGLQYLRNCLNLIQNIQLNNNNNMFGR